MKFGLTFKPVFTWSPRERKLRLFRVIYNRPWRVGNGWCSRTLSITIRPSLYQIQRDCSGFYLTVLGFGIHWKQIAGGYDS